MFVKLLIIFLLFPGVGNSQEKSIYFFSKDRIEPLYIQDWKVLDIKSFPLLTKGIPEEKWIPLEEYTSETQDNIGTWWLKAEISLDKLQRRDVLALYPSGFISAYEIYWDDQLVGSNGKPGALIQEEIAGKFFYITPLSDSLTTPGKHTLTLRISNHSPTKRKCYAGRMELGYYGKFLTGGFARQLKVFFVLGIMFIMAVFNMFLYFSRGRKLAHLIFSLLCMSVMADFITAYIWLFKDVNTRFISIQYSLFPLEAMLMSMLFSLFFVYEFDFPLKKVVYGIISFNLILYFMHQQYLMPGSYTKQFMIMTLSLTTSLIIWAVLKKKEGSWIALGGIGIGLIVFFFNFHFGIYRLAFITAIMVFSYSISIALKYARSEKLEKAALLRSSRLEIEILKKYISPHFLINSLTSISVWLRKNPRRAVKLIETLADEFRMISKVSPLHKIPVFQEIALCQAHLQIMNIRRNAQFTLNVEGVEEQDEIPPLIFHTLIENGLSHGYEGSEKGSFNLVRKEISTGIQYIFFNDSRIHLDTDLRNSGTGLKYIRVRLEECFPGRWKLVSRQAPGGWEVVIDIYNT